MRHPHPRPTQPCTLSVDGVQGINDAGVQSDPDLACLFRLQYLVLRRWQQYGSPAVEVKQFELRHMMTAPLYLSSSASPSAYIRNSPQELRWRIPGSRNQTFSTTSWLLSLGKNAGALTSRTLRVCCVHIVISVCADVTVRAGVLDPWCPVAVEMAGGVDPSEVNDG